MAQFGRGVEGGRGRKRELQPSRGSSAYKLNWQSVLFVGYGDARALDENENLEKAERQLFVKVSYAFQM